MIISESTAFWCIYIIFSTSIIYILNYIVKFIIELVIHFITNLYRPIKVFYTNLIKN
jgi:hypothetical protein